MKTSYAIATNTSYPAFDVSLLQLLHEHALAQHTDVFTINLHQLDLPWRLPDNSINTSIDDTIRGMLAIKSFELLGHKKIPVVTTDFKSNPGFLKMLEDSKNPYLTVQKQREGSTVGDARCDAFNTAVQLHEPDAVGLSEPEKLLGLPFLPQIADQVIKDEVDLLVLNRSLSFFQLTYPWPQYLSEALTNIAVNLMTGTVDYEKPHLYQYDFMGGFRIVGKNAFSLFREAASSYRLQPDEPLYGSYSHLMVKLVQALKSDMRVGSKEIGYLHPAIQTSLETHPERIDWYNDKRRKQRHAVIEECGRELGINKSERDIYRDLIETRLHRDFSLYEDVFRRIEY